MAYSKSDSLLLVGDDSEFDQIQTDFLQHFKNEIRISNMGGGPADSSDNGLETDKSCVLDHDSEATRDQIPVDALCNVLKLPQDSDVTSSRTASEESKLFDAGGGSSTATVQHCFSPGVKSFLFGCISTTSPEKPDESSAAASLPVLQKGRAVPRSNSTVSRVCRKVKGPPLNSTFPAKIGPYELKILKQPEEQHRARYLTEGSRGTVKDQSGQSHPTVKLCGYDQPVPLQVFVGTDVGKLKPHGFYQACKVSNKNSTACVERDIEGTTVIEIVFDPKQEMVSVVDCVGILKLRNADVEQRIGLAKSKKKSTCARLIFRVNIPKPDGTFHTLQVASSPIICTQPTGAPEISKKSINQCSVRGGDELFIIGKNFMKGTVVYFEEVVNDQPIWSREAEIDQDFFQATHLVCTVPKYRSLDIQQPVQIQVVVHSSGRTSDPVPFTYLPNFNSSVLSDAEASIPMETEPTVTKNASQEVSGLKRPYDSSPHSDGSYSNSTTDVAAEVSHILGHSGTATEFSGIGEEFADSKILVQQNDPGHMALGGETLFDASCVISGVDPLSKSPVDAYILPLQSLDSTTRSVENIPCFQDSKEAVAVPGVFENLYDTSIAPSLVGNILSSHSDRELETQLTNLIEAAHHQELMSIHDGIMNPNGRAGRKSLTEQINTVQSPTEHGGPLMGAENSDYGEPQSKRLASYQEPNMNLLIQLMHADNENSKLQPKDEMNWSGLSSSNFGMSADTNLQSIAGVSDAHDSHSAGSMPGQSQSTFALKNFDEPTNTTSMSAQQTMLFSFDHNVLQSSFLQSQVEDVKPDPSFSGINVYLQENIHYNNSSSPQNMDTSCGTGIALFQDNNQVSHSFSVPSVDNEDSKASLFGSHDHRRNSLSKSATTGSIAMGNQVHLVNIGTNDCNIVGMDFRNIGQQEFGNLKTNSDHLHDLMASHSLPNESHVVTNMTQLNNSNMMLHHSIHSSMNGSEMTMLNADHHLKTINQNFQSSDLHSYSVQDQTNIGEQHSFSQTGIVEVTPVHTFSDSGDEMPKYIGLEEMDALMHLSNHQSTTMNTLHGGLNNIAMDSTLHHVQIDVIEGCRSDLDHNNCHTTSALTIGNVSSLCTESTVCSDDGSMVSNLQKSLSELQDLKQQMGFNGGPQSPTRSKISTDVMSQMSDVTLEGSLSPKAEFSVSNETNLLSSAAALSNVYDAAIVQAEQEALHTMSSCSNVKYGSEMNDFPGSLGHPQTTCSSQILPDDTSGLFSNPKEDLLTQLYEKYLKFLPKSENLNVPMVSLSNSSSGVSLDSDVPSLVHNSSLPNSQLSTTVTGNYSGTKSLIQNDCHTLQGVEQSNMSQGPQVLLLTQSGSPTVVPLSSVLMSSSASNATSMTVSEQKVNEFAAIARAEASSDQPTALTLIDYEQLLANILPYCKLICLPEDQVSLSLGKEGMDLPSQSSKKLLLVPAEALKQPCTTVHLAGEQVLGKLSFSGLNNLYSLAVSNEDRSVKFLPGSASVPRCSDGSESMNHERMDQPMDTSSSPFSHFSHEVSGTTCQGSQQQQLADLSRNNSISSKMPTLLYQLLTNNEAKAAAMHVPPQTSAMSSLPNLSVDDVSRVLDMNRQQQRQ